MFCMKCGAQNENGAKFCTTCGASLEGITWSAPQDAPASAPAPETTPTPDPTPEPVETPTPEPAAEEAPQAPESWGDPASEMPPQEWPGASEPSPIQESGQAKRGLGTGAIVGIIVGGVVVVALIVVAALFMTGTLSLGGTTPDEPAKEEPAGDDGDISSGGEIGNLTGDPAEVVDVSGTVFDRASYDGTPAEIDEALRAAGLSLDGTSAYHYDDGSDSLYLDYTGTADGALPVEGADDEVRVALNFDAEEFDFPWDEDDSAYDFDVNPAELPADTELYAVSISFDADLEPEEFVSTIVALRDSLGLSGDVSMLSATSSELADQATDALGISDEASISIHEDASYDCVTTYFEDVTLDITRWSTGDTSVSIGYFG